MAFYAKNVARQYAKDRSNAHTFVTFLAVICILIGVIARIVAVGPLTNDPMVQAPFYDDGFYYLQIARNAATQGIFTFDGINRTNGFHPLWQLLLALIARFSIDDFQFIQLVMYFSIMLFALTGILMFRFVMGYGGPIAGLAAAILWSFSPDLIMWQNQGMENTIYLPLLVLALIQIDRFMCYPTNQKEAHRLGLVLGLLMWSRSDSVLFVVLALIGIVIYLWKELRSVPSNLVRALVIVIGLVFLFGVGYLLFNYYAAGSFLSVSGTVKLGDSFTRPWSLTQIVDAFWVHLSMIGGLFSGIGGLTWWALNWRILPFKVFAGVWTFAVILWWGSHRAKTIRHTSQGVRQTKKIALGLLLIYVVFHSIILITMAGEILRWAPWYIVPQVVTVLTVVALVLFPQSLVDEIVKVARTRLHNFAVKDGSTGSTFNRFRFLYPVIGFIIFVIAILVPCVWVTFVPISGWLQQTIDQKALEPRYELGVWLRDHVPPNAKVGMFDAGITGYFAHTHVINLDGLVNSPEYVSVVRSGDYADYIIDNKVDYLIEYYYPPYEMQWQPSDDSTVCHKLIHINKTPALWGADRVNNYFEVIALRYDGACHDSWEPGFPITAVPPGKILRVLPLRMERRRQPRMNQGVTNARANSD